MYQKLFEPLSIKNITLRGRLVMPPMNSHYGDTEHFFTEQGINYYGERALGGFSLLITEFLCISEEGLATTTQAGIYDDKFIPMLTRLTERVHANGSHIFAQLHHAGRIFPAARKIHLRRWCRCWYQEILLIAKRRFRHR